MAGTPRLEDAGLFLGDRGHRCPSWAMWSLLMLVMAVTSGLITLVLSSRPPKPVSTTAISTPCSAKYLNANGRQHVEIGRRWLHPGDDRLDQLRTSRAKSAWEIISPLQWRSAREYRPGAGWYKGRSCNQMPPASTRSSRKCFPCPWCRPHGRSGTCPADCPAS